MRIIVATLLALAGIVSAVALEPWGVVKLSVAHVRSDASHASEMQTQATMGTPVKLIEEQSDWYSVELPDGYRGWISRWSIEPMSQQRFDQWRNADRVVVIGNGHRTTTEMLSISDETPVSDLDRLDILEVVSQESDSTMVIKTPDGREGIVPANEVMDMNLFFRRGEECAIIPDADIIIRNAHDMLGRVYLWGGTSFKMTDCSGLTRICYMMNGMLLPRDTGPLSKVGTSVSLDDAQPGDLIFFANSKGRVNHVAIYLGNNRIIHSSGQVKINSLDPNASDGYSRKPHIIKHIGSSDIPGVRRISQHSWYFLMNN